MPKDPTKPKGRTSAYAFFVREKTQEYKDVGKKVDFTVFSKECSDLWREMDEDDRSKFVALAEQDRIRYKREMATWEPPAEEGGGRRKKRGAKKEKDPNKPKRGKSAFFMFSGEKRAEVKARLDPGAGVGDVAKELGELWRGMTKEEKAPYEVLAQKDRKRYEREMEVYNRKESYGAVGGDEYDEEEEEESD